MAGMLDGLPAGLHRLVLRCGQPLRLAWWRWRGRQVRGVGVVALSADGRVVLIRHSYHHPERWMLPAGGLRPGEDPAVTAARELAEETGCRLHDAQWFASHDSNRGGFVNRIELVAGHTHDMPRADGRELLAAALFDPDHLPHPLGHWTAAQLALWQAWRERTGS